MPMRTIITACIAAIMLHNAHAEDVYRDNVVIVLDASGSMADPMRSTGDRKMDAAKAALKEVLRQVPESTHIGLLVFSARSLRDDWAYPLGPRDDAAITAAIDKPQPGRGTPLGQYMKVAADRLLEEREKQYGYGTYRLLVVTDGEAGDRRLVEKYTPEIMARGITVDVIGVDMIGQHTLATKAHSYRSADDPESLTKAVQDVFAEISSDTASDTEADAFEVIQPIPFEVASGMIAALATSGNEPIGKKTGRRQQQQARTQQPPIQVQSPQGGSQPPPQPSNNDSGGGFSMWQILFVVVIIMLAVSRGANRARRRR